ncbi:hypothetical protein [Nocardia sp. XZ_19_231]|uniref:hypothetical protein n=1 Tax=Nocardia sp. XZ_19_231 TaxID=2769252 RepID=UPI00188DE686|nr:hypothetical protein [Nocardia sp. XZ_19_231]
MGSISPQSYESAAKECYDLSEKFQTVYNSLQTVLLETSAMAGGYQAVKTWSKAYDDRAAAVTLVATSFASALQHFGDILTAAGHNWKCGEYKANRDPDKGDPPALPSGFPSELPYGAGAVIGVASSGTNSRGLETDWTELQDKVTALVAGGEVPDGDTDKLSRAATSWKTFAQSDPAYGGKGRLLVVASGLERGYGSNVPEDIPNLAGHLRTLATSVGEIEAAARDIAAAVDAHTVALTTMRSDMNTQFAMVVVVTAIQIGRSMVQVKEPPTKQKTPSKQQTPSERQEEIDFLNQAAGALAGPANTFLTALSGFTFTTAVLTTGGLPTIAELAILITSIDDGALGGTDPVTKEIATKIANHANGRAEQGDGSHYVAGVPATGLAEYVRKVLDGEISTEQRYLSNGRTAYWDKEKGVLTIEDPPGGTVFTPAEGREKFDNIK